MTVGQFKKFVSMFTLNDTVIRYFDYKDIWAPSRFELHPNHIFDNYIVCAYFMLLEDNEVHVFLRAV